MDKLAEKLRADADRIDVNVSDELERRIDASLRAAQPELRGRELNDRRSATFWWTSSLTGAAAALILLTIINLRPATPENPPQTANTSPIATSRSPILEWHAESAMLTSPLQQELRDLQSDLKKAELIVKDDIGL